MKREIRTYSSFEEMNEADRKRAATRTPDERLQNLTFLKKQFLSFQGMRLEDLEGHLRNSDIQKKPVPWSDSK